MIRKKSAMATARRSGRRNLEFFASTGILKPETKIEVKEWATEAFEKYQANTMPRTEYQEIRLLREYIEANIR